MTEYTPALLVMLAGLFVYLLVVLYVTRDQFKKNDSED